MAIEYPIVSEYNMVDGTIQVSPYWFLCVIRFRDLVTFDRSSGDVNRSFSGALSNPVATRDPVFITDAMQLTISSSKESHVHTLSAVVMQSDTNYLSTIMPGDWVFAWILNDQKKAQDVLSRVKQTASGSGSTDQNANRWDDGLKFIGRIQGVRKTTAVNRDSGVVQASYLINAVAFQEFDSKLFYDTQLVRNDTVPVWMQRFGLIVQNIMNQNSFVNTAGTVDMNSLIPALLSVIFGKGAFANAGGIGDEFPASPNQAYLVPPEVSSLIGKYDFAFGTTTTNYASILDLIMGVQHYNAKENAKQAAPWELFTPDGLTDIPNIDENLTWFKTPNDMLGYFGLEFPPMNGTPVWNLLQNFLNAPLNEIYVTLRVNAQNLVVPTVVVRQLPMSTSRNPKDQGHLPGNAYPIKSKNIKDQVLANVLQPTINITAPNLGLPQSGQQLPDYDVTRFLELPRWVVDPAMIYSIDIGRSNVQRFNWIHIGGISNAANSPMDSTGTYVRAPPLRDDADIQRSGLRIFQTTVNTVLLDAFGGPVEWRDILADIVSGEQLTLTGTFVVQGISAPICVGDNLEFANTIYHIEQVTHSCQMDIGTGRKMFQTALAVSHGLANEYQQQDTLSAGGTVDESIFAGIVESEPVTVDVPETNEQDPTFDNTVPGSE